MVVEGYCVKCDSIKEMIYMEPWVECGYCSGREVYQSQEDYEEYSDLAALPPVEEYWDITSMRNGSISLEDSRSIR